MGQGRRILITGIAGSLAGRVAAVLESRDDVAHLVGVDIREPHHDLARTAFVHADIRNPLVAQRLRDDDIDTVLHLSTMSSPDASGGRTRMKERNVISTMQFVAACRATPTLDRFVLRSTTAVYGSDHRDPAFFTEDDVPRSPAEHGYAKDATEVEAYVRGLGAARPDVDVTVLRIANLVGPSIDSSFHALFTLPLVPTVVGFDPRLQFCHEDDAVDVLVAAAMDRHPGTFNVAGEGVLYLSQCVRIARHLPLPVPLPLVRAASDLVRRSGRLDVPEDQLRFLQHGRVVDTTRLRTEFGHAPRYTTRGAFEDLVARRRIAGPVDRDELARLGRELLDLADRWRQRVRVGADGATASRGDGPTTAARSGSTRGEGR